MRKNLINPKLDYAFKRIFGSTEHPNTCLNLVNAIFEAYGEPKIKELTVLNPAVDPTSLSDKSCILDLKAKTETGELINIEMQVRNTPSWIERILYYWGSLFINQLKKGEDYDELQRTITISLLDFNIFKRTTPISLYELQEHTDNERLTDLMQLYFIEFPKYDSTNSLLEAGLPESLNDWIRFFNARSEAELDQVAAKNGAILEATSMLKYISQNPKERERFEARQKAILDERNLINGSFREGKAEGLKEAAIRLLQSGATVEFVVNITGLKIEDVQALQE